MIHAVIQGAKLLPCKGSVIFSVQLQSTPGVIQLADLVGERGEAVPSPDSFNYRDTSLLLTPLGRNWPHIPTNVQGDWDM